MTTKLKSNMFPAGSAFRSPITSGVFNVGGRSYNDPVAVPYSGIMTLDFSTSCNFSVPLTGNIQLDKPIGLLPGQSGVIILSQGAVGTSTVSFNNVWKFVNGGIPIVPTIAYSKSLIVYYVESADRITSQFLISGVDM